jgi:hypothetical protein
MSFLMKPLKSFTSNIVKLINPFFEGAKKLIKGIFTKILGATGIGGLLANLLMNMVSDKFAYIINQIVMIFVLGLAGILFIIFDGTGLIYSEEKVKSVTDFENTVQEVEDNKSVFLDEDFIILE